MNKCSDAAWTNLRPTWWRVSKDETSPLHHYIQRSIYWIKCCVELCKWVSEDKWVHLASSSIQPAKAEHTQMSTVDIMVTSNRSTGTLWHPLTHLIGQLKSLDGQPGVRLPRSVSCLFAEDKQPLSSLSFGGRMQCLLALLFLLFMGSEQTFLTQICDTSWHWRTHQTQWKKRKTTSTCNQRAVSSFQQWSSKISIDSGGGSDHGERSDDPNTGNHELIPLNPQAVLKTKWTSKYWWKVTFWICNQSQIINHWPRDPDRLHDDHINKETSVNSNETHLISIFHLRLHCLSGFTHMM